MCRIIVGANASTRRKKMMVIVTLIGMTEQNYQKFLSQSIIDYADDKVKAGTWAPSEAQELSSKEFERILPEGLNTSNSYLYSVVDPALDLKVGYLWIHLSDGPLGRSAFIYDIAIYKDVQGKGYGTQTMLALEEEAKRLQVDRISLHVFGHNKIAFGLYQKMGYQITDISMSKKL